MQIHANWQARLLLRLVEAVKASRLRRHFANLANRVICGRWADKSEKMEQLFREAGFSLRVETVRFSKLRSVFSIVGKRVAQKHNGNRPTVEANKRASGPEPPLLPEGYGRAATAGRKRSPEEAQG